MDPYIGEIKMFGGTYAPQGWMTCDGQLLSINQYSALFSILGTSYGGDGYQTFALPNLASRAPIHSGPNPSAPISRYSVGQPGGQEQITLSQAQMPAHNHAFNVNSTAASQIHPNNNFLGLIADPVTGEGTNLFAEEPTDGSVLANKSLSTVGGSQPVNITSPVLAVTFIIAITGIWPPRP